MPPPDSAPRSTFVVPAAALVPAAVLGLAALGLAGLLHRERQLTQGLRGELTELRVAHRRASSRETVTAGALKRAERLEEALAVMRREAGNEGLGGPGRAAELERVITFLRGEITAAQETIERLKQGAPAAVAKGRER